MHMASHAGEPRQNNHFISLRGSVAVKEGI